MNNRIEEELTGLAEGLYNFRKGLTIRGIRESVRSFLLANHLEPRPQPLDDKKLREKIARFLYDNFNTTSKGSWEQLPKFNEARQWWLIKDDQILALLQPKIEEARRQGYKEAKDKYDISSRGCHDVDRFYKE